MRPECTITIRDEVNCHISPLDPDTEMKVIESLSWYKKGYQHSPAYDLNIWDGKIYLYNRGFTYHYLLDEDIISLIERRGYDVRIVDNRPEIKIEPELVDASMFDGLMRPDGRPAEVRPYQIDAVNIALEQMVGCLEIATAGGKTFICASIAKQLGQYGRVMCVVPNKDLVVQTAKSFNNMGIDAGLFYGDRKDLTNITVATWQSLNNYPELVEGVVGIVVDECQKASAEVLQKLLSQPSRHIPWRLGFTGTLPKDPLERAQIRSVLGPSIFRKTAKELQDEGYLATCMIDIVQTMEGERGKVLTDYTTEYNFLTTNERRLKWVASQLRHLARNGNTLVLVRNKKTGKMLESFLDGEDVVYLDGDVKSKKRTSHYEGINDKNNAILICTMGIAAAGIDLPRLFNLVIFEVGKSFIDVLQSIGRSLRKAEDKDHANVFDFCADTKYSKRHLSERKAIYDEAAYPYRVTKVRYLE